MKGTFVIAGTNVVMRAGAFLREVGEFGGPGQTMGAVTAICTAIPGVPEGVPYLSEAGESSALHCEEYWRKVADNL